MTNRHEVPDAAHRYDDADQFRSELRSPSRYHVSAADLSAQIAVVSPYMAALLAEADAADRMMMPEQPG